MPKPKRGEIWTVDLDPTRRHEQAGKRPALVLSANLFNQGPAGLSVVLPITSIAKGIPFHVPIDPPEGGLSVRSYVKCEDVRSVAIERLSKRWGTVRADTMMTVEDRMRILLDL